MTGEKRLINKYYTLNQGTKKVLSFNLYKKKKCCVVSGSQKHESFCFPINKAMGA